MGESLVTETQGNTCQETSMLDPGLSKPLRFFYHQSSTAITPFHRSGKLRHRKITYCSEGDPGFELTDLIPHREVTTRKSTMFYLHHGRSSLRADRRKKKRKKEKKGGRRDAGEGKRWFET